MKKSSLLNLIEGDMWKFLRGKAQSFAATHLTLFHAKNLFRKRAL
jgi:hypothetical protein